MALALGHSGCQTAALGRSTNVILAVVDIFIVTGHSVTVLEAPSIHCFVLS